MSISLRARDRPVCGRHFDVGTEGVRAHATECREPANRWDDESKRRYEELTRKAVARRATPALCKGRAGDIGAALVSAVKALFCDGHHIAKRNGCLSSTLDIGSGSEARLGLARSVTTLVSRGRA